MKKAADDCWQLFVEFGSILPDDVSFITLCLGQPSPSIIWDRKIIFVKLGKITLPATFAGTLELNDEKTGRQTFQFQADHTPGPS
ncbi:hypothetical protein [Photobacterium sp. 1_MG-2023]|uniref:hypothetical protein n=1 Tax=Photobacterium sp. 1_MG-2023 TaxID=3062646 RepID=UPI0026E449BF|nr:hypothetical protein [Photobacterium sp. 1_MG-2023]MDO6705400.1 hypothetical protein [Photobacterium sp. 1_MG-2023]